MDVKIGEKVVGFFHFASKWSKLCFSEQKGLVHTPICLSLLVSPRQELAPVLE